GCDKACKAVRPAAPPRAGGGHSRGRAPRACRGVPPTAHCVPKWRWSAVTHRHLPARCASTRDQPGRTNPCAATILACCPRPRVLAAEILDVPEPVAHDALQQPASEMRADAPENQAKIVFRVIFDRQSTQQHEAAPVLDLPEGFLDDWAQRGHLKMLAL